jgi:hypothetical protein
MNGRLILTLIACSSELAVEQILFLIWYNNIFYFSRQFTECQGWAGRLSANSGIRMNIEFLYLRNVPDSEGTVSIMSLI